MVMEAAAEGAKDFKLVGYDNFTRNNPRTDRFPVLGFHHIEFWCADATNTAGRFSYGLGIPITSKSDISTGNTLHASYVLRSDKARILFSAPYPSPPPPSSTTSPAIIKPTIPSFDSDKCRTFATTHGISVRSIAIIVEDCADAFNISVANGARPAFPPSDLGEGYALSEVQLYGDVVLRYISIPTNPTNSFLPGFEDYSTDASPPDSSPWRSIDHLVGCLAGNFGEVLEYVQRFTGFHEFLEFTAEDVGSEMSGVNGVVLGNNNEDVLMLITQPVNSAKQQSQLQQFLDYNVGDGVQHIALLNEDILSTVREMRKRSGNGGFEFMSPPPPNYYTRMRASAGDVLSEEQIRECEELGVLVDRDPEGMLLQIFTKPVGDRPTIVIEIIQRIGCMTKDDEGRVTQRGGCGGFGKGNITELIKCLQEYQKSLEDKQR